MGRVGPSWNLWTAMPDDTSGFLLPLGFERDPTVRLRLGSTNDLDDGKGSSNNGRPNSLNRPLSTAPRPAWTPYQTCIYVGQHNGLRTHAHCRPAGLVPGSHRREKQTRSGYAWVIPLATSEPSPYTNTWPG